jgi:hypothetical protein
METQPNPNKGRLMRRNRRIAVIYVALLPSGRLGNLTVETWQRLPQSGVQDQHHQLMLKGLLRMAPYPIVASPHPSPQFSLEESMRSVPVAKYSPQNDEGYQKQGKQGTATVRSSGRPDS